MELFISSHFFKIFFNEIVPASADVSIESYSFLFLTIKYLNAHARHKE